MNVYRRYFRVASGPLLDAVKEANDINKKAREEYETILDSLGAKSTQWYQRDDRIVGLIFDDPPDTTIYKKTRIGGWWPKQNSKKAKEISNRLKSVKTKCVQDCMQVVGLSHMPTIFGDSRAHYPTMTIIPSDPLLIFVSVPWYDEDPQVIEQYKVDRANKTHFSTNLDSILWEPSPDMISVKKWEVERAVAEWNESLESARQPA
jgi:hypothetical protein